MAQMSSPKPKPPDATADRSEITKFIRWNHICLTYDYGLPCNRLARYACPYKHDGDIFIAGFMSAVSLNAKLSKLATNHLLR